MGQTAGPLRGRIEEACAEVPAGFDLAGSSLAFHHVPRDGKLAVARRLARSVDHLLLLEVEGNHDLPGLHGPELSVSLYQVYGGGAAFVLDAGTAPATRRRGRRGPAAGPCRSPGSRW